MSRLLSVLHELRDNAHAEPTRHLDDAADEVLIDRAVLQVLDEATVNLRLVHRHVVEGENNEKATPKSSMESFEAKRAEVGQKVYRPTRSVTAPRRPKPVLLARQVADEELRPVACSPTPERGKGSRSARCAIHPLRREGLEGVQL
jgi:hypothetical protein